MPVANTSRTTTQAIMVPVEGIVHCSVMPPRIVTLTGNSNIILDTRDDNDPTRAAGAIPGPSNLKDPCGIVRIEIENLDAAAIKIAINNTASANEYHYILKSATSDKAGDGEIFTIPLMSFLTISALGTVGKQLSIVIYYTR